MEVVNFYSALTHTNRNADSQWLISAASKNFTFYLPDGTSLVVDVKIKDSSGLKTSDFVDVTIWLNDRLIEYGEESARATNGSTRNFNTARSKQHIARLLNLDHFPLHIRCRPPKPKYKTPDEEPDDNSPAMRASRYAGAQIDLSKAWNASATPEELVALVWVQLYVMVTLLPDEEAFNVLLGPRDAHDELAELLQTAGLGVKHPLDSEDESLKGMMILCTRAAFWKTVYPFNRSPWLLPKGTTGPRGYAITHPASYIFQDGIYHPRRPPKPKPSDGPLYIRYIQELGETLTFEVVSSKDDAFVKKFTEWHNSSRVSSGWRQAGSEDEQRAYLRKIEESESIIGLVGKWNGQPWGYLEVYWVKESNIGTFYDCADYDRGFHALVGEEKYRGPHRVRTWMGSLIHLMFIMDPRTQRAVLEPRASNSKMISYAQMCGAHVEKLIDLPHKRAALVICPREGFFQLCPLGPITVLE